MTPDELIANVESALGPLVAAYRGTADASDLYEASLFAIAVQAAEQAGGTCMLTTDGTSPAAELIFRRSPGNLWAGNFTYGLVSFPGSIKRLEVHLGVYVVGASGVRHESDVALLDAQEAERSRRGELHPRRRGLIATIEAKHYVVSPGIGVGRGFLGLSIEFGQTKCSLTFPAKSADNIAALIAGKHSECFDEVIPSEPAADRLRAHLEQAIRNWLTRAR